MTDKLTEYETIRGYRLPQGWTRARLDAERARYNIDADFVPLASGGGGIAWGVPYLLQYVSSGLWRSLDGRFESLNIGGGQFEVADTDAPGMAILTYVRSINEAEAWCRERALAWSLT